MENRIPKDSLKTFSAVSYWAIILYFLDIILLGSGQMTKVGVFSTRTLFFAVAFLAAVPLMFRKLKELIRNPFFLGVAAFFLCIAYALAIGWMRGNSRTIIKTDVLGYLNFAILPAMLCVLNSRERIEQTMKAIAFASIVVSAATIAVSFFMFYPNPTQLYEMLKSMGLCAITKMTKYSVRVFFHTGGRFCLVGYIFALYFALKANCGKRQRILWALGAVALIVAIFLSYSRAQYVGSILAAFAFAIFYIRQNKKETAKVWKLLLCSFAAALVVIGGLSVLQRADMFKTAYYRVVISVAIPNNDLYDSDTQKLKKEADEFVDFDQEFESINVRAIKISMLDESISRSPVIGNGLGAAINYDDGYVEYSYYDILNKMGVIGLAVFFSPFILMAVFLRKNRKKGIPGPANHICFSCFAVMVYFLFIAYFNPSMNTTVGISCYAFGMAAFTYCSNPANTAEFQEEDSAGKLPGEPAPKCPE